MKKFRKKPVVIEAVQLTEQNIRQIYELVNNEKVSLESSIDVNKWNEYCDMVKINGLNIPTLEDGQDKRAKHVATIGDWIIKGIQGEFYPCKPDIFEATYEPEHATLERIDDFFTEVEVTSCCKRGPITDEKYCPYCGKEIKRTSK